MSNLVIYTDGSHLKHTNGRLGIGGVILKDGVLVDKFSQELSVSYLRVTYGTSDVSNPTCEMLAALWALMKFKKHIGPNDSVTLKADYTGVKAWCTGEWKINKPYIAKIKSDIDEETKRQSLVGRIMYEWIRGHQKDLSNPDVYWNSIVDALAKGQDPDI